MLEQPEVKFNLLIAIAPSRETRQSDNSFWLKVLTGKIKVDRIKLLTSLMIERRNFAARGALSNPETAHGSIYKLFLEKNHLAAIFKMMKMKDHIKDELVVKFQDHYRQVKLCHDYTKFLLDTRDAYVEGQRIRFAYSRRGHLIGSSDGEVRYSAKLMIAMLVQFYM